MNDIHILHLHWRHLYFFSMFVFRPILNVFSRLMWQRSNLIFFRTDNQVAKHHLLFQHYLFSQFPMSTLCSGLLICLSTSGPAPDFNKQKLHLPTWSGKCPSLPGPLFFFYFIIFFSFILFLKVRWLYCTFTFSHTHFRISLSKFHENPVGILRGISLKGEMTSLGYLFFPSVN